MIYANVGEDLAPRFPRALTSDEQAAAVTLLADASFWLEVWVPGLADAATTNEQVAMAAKLLVVAMVKRAILAPKTEESGVQSSTESWGPYNKSITYRNPEGNLYLYGTELESITSLLRSSTAAAVSMRSPGL